ncbi:MAG: Lipoate-protein ligase A [Candidatus Bipolaricaulis sibiricus]|uniref:Lipoate-protein ligase A n=1 Tax=Bipolaricaulis sibiricus TaxID=2501609 RepID=A0A410FWB3_BIPS1|nr:MAG: Lipoate-protein ligase A [Candidatus Bipolaricaulis sibiricus]
MRILLDLPYRDPALNLALDEAILSAVACGNSPPTLRIWRNPRCVVVGRGQRIEDEADLTACKEFRIPVLQRSSGGGAVYHHPGNLNFSLCLPLVDPWTSVRESQDLITDHLAQTVRRRLGLPVDARDGAVFAGDRKISGSAQLRRRAVLHHGTLILAADVIPMDTLLLALRPGYSPRGVASRPAVVGDLGSLIGRAVPIEEGVRTILAAFRPLGRAGMETISLHEWALADIRLASARGAG